MTFKKIKWSLRFPLPLPILRNATRRFSSTPTFHNGPASAEALDGAIRVAAPFIYLSPAVHLLPDANSFGCQMSSLRKVFHDMGSPQTPFLQIKTLSHGCVPVLSKSQIAMSVMIFLPSQNTDPAWGREWASMAWGREWAGIHGDRASRPRCTDSRGEELGARRLQESRRRRRRGRAILGSRALGRWHRLRRRRNTSSRGTRGNSSDCGGSCNGGASSNRGESNLFTEPVSFSEARSQLSAG